MEDESTCYDPGCVDAATIVLGDKWTPRIIRAIARKEPIRFGELQELTGGVNPRTLSSRLCSLEEAGIITKMTYAEVPPRSEYKLTQKGIDLLPILKDMAKWGQKYNPRPHTNIS
jgi:DNA-binding HxlR family transcriptional regulator